jgi:tRNA(His) guanylyltransferase
VRFSELEAAQRERERYHDLCVPDDKWIVVRVDGRSFTTLTNAHFTKPFDDRFGELMAVTAAALLKEFAGVYVYLQSDEISLLLPRSTGAFGRGVEKLVSLTAATASAAFTEAAGRRVGFDSRIWTGETVEDVVDYFAWRQADANRNALNTCLYWALREQGLTAPQTHRRMAGLDREAKKEAVATYGPAFDERPAWQRLGAGVWFETVEKHGQDPRTRRPVTVTRRRLHHEFELPVGAEYRDLVAGLL